MKRVLGVIGVTALAILGGCSSQDFGRPVGKLGDIVDAGTPYVDSQDKEAEARRAAQLARVMALWQQQKGAESTDYNVGPDDVLTVSVLSLETPDETAVLTRTVSKDGTITLPLIGAVAVSGRPARDVQQLVTEAYNGRYLKDPQVNVTVAEYRAAPVVVTGAVKMPGVYYLRHNVSSVLEVLSLADGVTPAAGIDLLIVRKGADAPAASAEESPAPVEVEGVSLADEPVSDEALEPVPLAADDTEEPSLPEEGALDQDEDELAADIAAFNAALASLADDESFLESAPDTALPEEAMVVPDAAADRMELAGADSSMDEAPTEAPTEAETDDVASAETGSAAELITVDLRRLLDEGDMRMNLEVYGGDIITVPPGQKRFIYVLGYVQRPGAFELQGRDRVRALQAVAMAGGLSSSARAQNSFLIIDKPQGRQVVSVDLTKIARGVRPPVYMEPGSTLVVGSGMFAKLAEFIKPSIGASASLTPVP